MLRDQCQCSRAEIGVLTIGDHDQPPVRRPAVNRIPHRQRRGSLSDLNTLSTLRGEALNRSAHGAPQQDRP